jgi:hypothetical protein
MRVCFSIGISLMVIAGVAGCASNQAPAVSVAQVIPSASTCVGCKVAPYYAVAVTRPAVCNDYPVSYRVQIPDVDDRVRPVERPQLISNGGVVQSSSTAQCCR